MKRREFLGRGLAGAGGIMLLFGRGFEAAEHRYKFSSREFASSGCQKGSCISFWMVVGGPQSPRFGLISFLQEKSCGEHGISRHLD